MSKQATLTSFFNVRKAPSDDAHAVKKRKVETSSGLGKVTETITKAEVTKVVCAQSPEVIVSEHTPDVSSGKNASKNGKRRKADAAPVEAKEPILFTVGTTTTKAKRKLNMDGALDEQPVQTTKKNVVFEQKGLLSPSKKAKQESAQTAPAAPVAKGGSAGSVSSLMDRLKGMDSKEAKAKIKTVNKLADLQAQLRSLKKDPNLAAAAAGQSAKAKRALFQEPGVKKEEKPQMRQPVPLMSPKKMPASSSVTSCVKTVLSPGKASPRKAIPAFVRYQELAQPDQFLPLPNRYKALTEVFRSVDVIVSMKFNRKEMIRVPDLKPAVQNITRKTFSDFYLRQIRTVFPKAYRYVWEKINDRLGRHTGDFVLHMSPDHGVGIKSQMSPLVKVERLKMFQHSLLSIVHDYHRQFLASLGISGLEDTQVNRWHKDFSLEAVPDIQEEPLPPKPEVEKARNAKEMLEKLAGVNDRLEASLKNMKEAAVKVEDKSDGAGPSGAAPPAVAIRKELRGLPKSLIEKILANEKARQIKEMTQSSEERKDLEQLEELVSLSTVIVNCHRAHRKGAAVPIDTLAQVTSDSCGRKSKAAMLPLIRLFLQSVPQCMEIKTIERVQYVKLKKDSPDVNQVKKILEDMVASAKTKK